MQLVQSSLVFSATDINNHVACEHLTSLNVSALYGERSKPDVKSAQADLLAELGKAHEANYFARLRAGGHAVTVIDRSAGIAAAAAATERAMSDGAEIIYQATFFDGMWLGYADFLRRVDAPRAGSRWSWSYEVEDTKLARETEPYFLLQLAYYSEHVERVQGVAPESMTVVLGDVSRRVYRVADFAAYFRAVKKRFLDDVVGNAAPYPSPVGHCEMCVWSTICKQQWAADDHLSLVANMTRLQTARLNASGVPTLAALAQAPDTSRPPKMTPETFAKIRRQARLQDEQRRAIAARAPDPYKYDFIAAPPEVTSPHGFGLLPAPSDGDVFFDMEGDPYYEIGTGLEYLFGAYTPERAFHAFWGCDRDGVAIGDRLAEKRAFEAFIDFVVERRARHPDMHIYHYAAYEKTALQKLCLRHATREAEVDTILREERLVDLYRVVRQALVVGQPSYSIKKIEEYYGKRGDDSSVKGGSESILQFEEWLAMRHDPERRDDAILDDLEKYNEYDCVSTLGLRDWLLWLVPKAEAVLGHAIPRFTGPAPEPDTKKKNEAKHAALIERLDAHIPPDYDPSVSSADDARIRPIFLARHMLEYFWREDKPVWWRFYDLRDSYRENPAPLLDDSGIIIGLKRLPVAPVLVGRSPGYRMSYPPQLHKLKAGDVYDPESGDQVGSIRDIDDRDDGGELLFVQRPKFSTAPLPRAVLATGIVPAGGIVDALARFAGSLVDDGAPRRYRAAYDVLTRAIPRLSGHAPGRPIQPSVVTPETVGAVVDALDDSYVFIQGPPGAGKTFIGARLIVDAIEKRQRVGVLANSHKSIHNLLDEVERVAAERGVDFIGVKKTSKDNLEQHYGGAHFRNDTDTLAHDDALLVAGTAWAFAPAAMDGRLDVLFVDEAGQVALPSAIAAMTSSAKTVFLGDPLQLGQVTHTEHPGNVGASVLEHLLGGELRPVAPDRGILLTDSYRMHPDVCSFISDLLYEGKLQSAPGRERQTVASPGLSGTGLRYLPVAHEDNAQRSIEEARVVADEIERLLEGTITDVDGATRAFTAADVIVVSPYNAHVDCIKRELGSRPACAAVEVGTVDKFQGREAYVVFFATGASSADDAPRGFGFVFDRQRFNVAISRARAVAVMVGSPQLLHHRCSSVEDVRIANGVARFIERASERSARSYALR